MFKNKHITTAMIVAPLLAVISYFATDYIVSDIPQAVSEGDTYALVARSNCRYASGVCTLRNGDVEVKLKLDQDGAGNTVLRAHSNLPLLGAQVALVNNKDTGLPTSLTKTGDREWQLDMKSSHDDTLMAISEIRIAMVSEENTFYGSTSTEFFRYDTVFPRQDW